MRTFPQMDHHVGAWGLKGEGSEEGLKLKVLRGVQKGELVGYWFSQMNALERSYREYRPSFLGGKPFGGKGGHVMPHEEYNTIRGMEISGGSKKDQNSMTPEKRGSGLHSFFL